MDIPVKRRGRGFSFEARRSGRVLLRVPVWISTPNSNQSFDAWTLVINKHGARFQSGHAFIPNQEIGLALSNGRTVKGRVIWANSVPNLDGTFEFAVALDEPTNLFDVSFPPQDRQKP